MTTNLFITSPLEQFEILPLYLLKFGFFDISITNQTIILITILFFITTFFFALLKQSTFSLYLVPTKWQIFIEIIYGAVLGLVTSYINGKKKSTFFPINIYNLFLYCLYEFNRFNTL